MAITGEPGRPPARNGIPLADLSGGFFSAQGILAALYDRERTGKGRYVELSMFDAMLALMSYIGTIWLTKGELPKPQGSAHEYSVPWQAFEASDGYLVVATRQEIFWQKLCAALDAPELADDPRYATNPDARRKPRHAGAAARSHLPHAHGRRLDEASCARPKCRPRRSTISTPPSPSRRSRSAR